MSVQPTHIGTHRDIPLYKAAETHLPCPKKKSVYGVIYGVKTSRFWYKPGNAASYQKAVKDLCENIDMVINAVNHIRNLMP